MNIRTFLNAGNQHLRGYAAGHIVGWQETFLQKEPHLCHKTQKNLLASCADDHQEWPAYPGDYVLRYVHHL